MKRAADATSPIPAYKRDLTVGEIEAALVALLSAIEAEEARRARAKRAAGPVELRTISAAELGGIEPDVWYVEALAKDPVGRACREQIKALGHLLFRVSGSIGAMRATLGRVAARKAPQARRRVSIVDKCWSGIGDGVHGRWSARASVRQGPVKVVEGTAPTPHLGPRP